MFRRYGASVRFRRQTCRPVAAAGDKYRSSTWIGFDGQRRYTESTLPQFGTAQNIDPVDGRSDEVIIRVVAMVGKGRRRPGVSLRSSPAPTIHPGDLIMCFMQVANNRTEVSFVITNLTTGGVVHSLRRRASDHRGAAVQGFGSNGRMGDGEIVGPP